MRKAAMTSAAEVACLYRIHSIENVLSIEHSIENVLSIECLAKQ